MIKPELTKGEIITYIGLSEVPSTFKLINQGHWKFIDKIDVEFLISSLDVYTMRLVRPRLDYLKHPNGGVHITYPFGVSKSDVIKWETAYSREKDKRRFGHTYA